MLLQADQLSQSAHSFLSFDGRNVPSCFVRVFLSGVGETNTGSLPNGSLVGGTETKQHEVMDSGHLSLKWNNG